MTDIEKELFETVAFDLKGIFKDSITLKREFMKTVHWVFDLKGSLKDCIPVEREFIMTVLGLKGFCFF